MKKLCLIFALLFTLICATANRAAAQEKGDWTLGIRTGLYTHTGDGAKYGLGLAARYNPADGFRIEPSVAFIFGRNCSVDVSINAHYVFNVNRARTMWLYPIVGIGINQINRWSMGISLGAGYDWDFHHHWALSGEVIYLVQTADHQYVKNPIVPRVGLSYKF